jgi:hypothetical protein
MQWLNHNGWVIIKSRIMIYPNYLEFQNSAQKADDYFLHFVCKESFTRNRSQRMVHKESFTRNSFINDQLLSKVHTSTNFILNFYDNTDWLSTLNTEPVLKISIFIRHMESPVIFFQHLGLMASSNFWR